MGTLIGIGNIVGMGGGAVFSPEAITLFSAMTVQPSGARKAAINSLIVALKAAGAWDRFDRFYMMAAHSEQAAKLDWKNPGTDNLVASGTVRFETDRGFIGTTGSGMVVNTVNFDDLSQYSLDDAHFSMWTTRDTTGTTSGDNGALGVRVSPFLSGGLWGVDVGINVANSAGSNSFACTIDDDFPINGWFMGSRTSSTHQRAFLNGVQQSTDAARASVAVPAAKMMCINNTKSDFAFMSAGLNIEAMAPAVFAALETYMEAVGVLKRYSSTFDWTFDFIANPSLLSPEGFLIRSYSEPQTVYDFEMRPWYTEYREIPFEGYRRVRNMFAAPTSTLATQTVTVVAGREYRVSFTGTGTITITGAASATLAGQGASSRVASDVLTATTASLVCTVSGDVREAQCEEVTFQTDQNPAEYVSVGDLPTPFHGCGVDGIKYFTTENGNTVASELVTEATGSDISTSTLRGLSSWTNSTNKCLQSENFGTTWAAVGTPTRSAAAKYIGPIALDLIGDDDGAALEGYTQDIAFANSSVSGGSNYKGVSVFFSEGSSASTVIRLRDTTAGADRLLAAITWAGGVPTVTMTTGVLYEVETLVNGCFRACMQSTDVTVTNTNQLQIYPASDAALDTTATGNIYIGGVQAEDYPFPSPYIPVTTAAASRVSLTLGDISYFGEDLTWVNPDEFSFVVEASMDRSVNVAANTAQQYTVELNDPTTAGSNRIMCLRYDDTELMTFQSLVGGVQQTGALTNVSWPDGTIHKMAVAYKENDAASCVDGGSVSTDTVCSLPANLRGLGITARYGAIAGRTQISLRKFKYFGSRLLDAQLQTESTYP